MKIKEMSTIYPSISLSFPFEIDKVDVFQQQQQNDNKVCWWWHVEITNEEKRKQNSKEEKVKEPLNYRTQLRLKVREKREL